MFHMLNCINLNEGVSIEEFDQSLDALSVHLQKLDLLDSAGPIGRRQRHPVMDTDDERDHEYFFILTFKDRDQCDRAVEYIYAQGEEAEGFHQAVLLAISDPVFMCWEDLDLGSERKTKRLGLAVPFSSTLPDHHE